MSGGVDSSVVAALMAQQHGLKNVWGVYMRLHNEAPQACSTRQKTCCGDADAADAQLVANKLGIDFDVLELHESFNKIVMKNYVEEIKAGRTPIPCTHCNSRLKFDLLFKFAKANKCDFIATGHYAEMIDGVIKANLINPKDQTYYLWAIKKENINKLMFPLAGKTKQEVRQLAEGFELITAQKKESMNLCFIPDGKTNKFIDKVLEPTMGVVKLYPTGETLLNNINLNHFTIGQRSGLGIAHAHPLYVRRKDIQNKVLWVAKHTDITQNSFHISNANWLLDPDTVTKVKIRSVSQAIKCAVNCYYPEPFVTLDELQVITPGQAAVFYDDNNNLIGGGWIS